MTAAAPEPPTNVQIVNSCEKACPVSVTWLAPKYESKITGYLVLVSDPTSKDFKTTNCYSANGWIDHCCLDEEAFGFGSTLALQVVAQSNQGNSIPSEIATLSLICPPSRPLQVRCTQQENAVSLNWNPPEHENGSQVTSFNVWQKAPQESSFTLIRSNIVQRELSLEFQGDLNYSFRV